MSEEDLQLALYLRGVSAWSRFEEGVRALNRHHAREPEYFAQLLQGCRAAAVSPKAGSTYYRARILPLADQYRTDPLPASEMGPPPAKDAAAGRLNPDGIPYLYLADTDATAIAEVRPWRQARVAVARLTLVADLTVVDLRVSVARAAPLDPAHWAAFALGRPAHREDRLAYVATQLLAETLKQEGFAGIQYSSSLHPTGYNLALFDPQQAMVRDVRLYAVGSVMISSSEIAEREIPSVGTLRRRSPDAS